MTWRRADWVEEAALAATGQRTAPRADEVGAALIQLSVELRSPYHRALRLGGQIGTKPKNRAETGLADKADAMLSRNLERTLRRAVALANARQHEHAILEHLLTALIEDQDAANVLEACAVEVERLRANLNDFLDHELTSLAVEGVADAKPTAGFQRVIQRAAGRAPGEAGYPKPRSGRPCSQSGRRMRYSSCKSRTCRAWMPSLTSVTASRSGRATSVTAAPGGRG